jgi:hypothetical protein
VPLIRQYRHPVGAWLFESPAGLLDVPGEDPWYTAQREFAEEANYRAKTWYTLVDLLNSPGGRPRRFGSTSHATWSRSRGAARPPGSWRSITCPACGSRSRRPHAGFVVGDRESIGGCGHPGPWPRCTPPESISCVPRTPRGRCVPIWSGAAECTP